MFLESQRILEHTALPVVPPVPCVAVVPPVAPFSVVPFAVVPPAFVGADVLAVVTSDPAVVALVVPPASVAAVVLAVVAPLPTVVALVVVKIPFRSVGSVMPPGSVFAVVS